MVFYAATDGANYGSAIQTIDLSTTDTAEHRVPLTANESTGMKNTGKKVSFRILESAELSMPDIEQIELLYYPGVVR